MIHKVIVATIIILNSILMSSAQGGIVSYQGSFADADQIFLLEFSIDTPSSLSIQGFGYGGGVNGSAVNIQAGGFDTIISLFSGSGGSASLIEFNDDGVCPPGSFDGVTGGCLDSTLRRDLVLPGIYTIALSASFNAPVGLTLGDGFSGGGSFFDVFGDNRTGNYAFDVATNSLQAIPEPGSLWLIVVALATLIFAKSRLSMRRAVSLRSSIAQWLAPA